MSRLFLTVEELEALDFARKDDLLCYDCVVKRAISIAGQAFTDFECRRCKQTRSYHNTSTPNFCKGCAFETFKCQRCMESLQKDLQKTDEAK